MQRWLRAFFDDTNGAVTVDWVVLSAAVIGLCMLVLGPIAYGTENVTQNLADYITDVPVGYDR